MKKRIAFFLIAAIAVWGLVLACNSDPDNPPEGGGTYTVTFDKNHDGEEGDWSDAKPQTKSVTPGRTVGTLPEPPTREDPHYSFLSWNTEEDGSGDTFFAETPVTGNITVYAQWRQGYAYLITFNKNNNDPESTEADPPAKTVSQSAQPTNGIAVGILPAEPTRPGHYFIEWNRQADGEGETVIATSRIDENTIVYAIWRESTVFTVTFNKNNTDPGSTEADPQTKTVTRPATTIDALPSRPTRPGHFFIEWNTQANGLGTEFTEDTPVNASIPVYAKWLSEEEADAYTVTFNKNHSDTAGFTEADPPTMDVVFNAGELPEPPTRSEGWGAGTTFDSWNTKADGSGDPFDVSTPVVDDIEVFAQWKFVPGTLQVVGDTAVVIGPEMGTNQGDGGTQGSWNSLNTVNNDGSVFFEGSPGSYSGGAVQYMFPAGIDDYDFVEVDYVRSGNLTVLRKIGATGVGWFTYVANAAGDEYPNIQNTGTWIFAIKTGGYETGIALQRNSGEGAIKMTKMTFTKGTRHTITFDASDTGYTAETIPSMQAVATVAIGPLPVPAERSGYNFTGWMNGSTPVLGATFMPANDLNLKAAWAPAQVAAPITVDFRSPTVISAMGTGSGTALADGTGYTVTIPNYGHTAKFTVTLASGISLADYDKISFTITGTAAGTDNNNKSIYVMGGSPLGSTNFTQADMQTGKNVTDYTGSPQNFTVGDTGSTTLEFRINKANANFTGTIELAVAAWAGGGTVGAQYNITNFQLTQD